MNGRADLYYLKCMRIKVWVLYVGHHYGCYSRRLPFNKATLLPPVSWSWYSHGLILVEWWWTLIPLGMTANSPWAPLPFNAARHHRRKKVYHLYQQIANSKGCYQIQRSLSLERYSGRFFVKSEDSHGFLLTFTSNVFSALSFQAQCCSYWTKLQFQFCNIYLFFFTFLHYLLLSSGRSWNNPPKGHSPLLSPPPFVELYDGWWR